MIAHRGASLTHPENTLEAFEAAVQAGADMIELDVRLTKDGVAVVSHDLDVSNTTDGEGLVCELTLAELKRFDASRGRSRGGPSEWPRTEIPTLAAALALLAGRVRVDIEIKNLPDETDFDSPDESVAVEVVKLLDQLAVRDRVLVTSFNWLSIERVRELAPDVETGFVTNPAIDPKAALVYARGAGHAYVLPHSYALVDAGAPFVAEAHADGIRVGTWTVDDARDIAQLFDWGVDAVVTNDPATGVRVRDGHVR